MKKFILIPLLFTTLLLNAQFSINTPTNGLCLNPATTVAAWVASSPSNAATYSWSVVSPSCTASYTALGASGSSVAIAYPCCGLFTLNCSAYTNTGSVISSTTTTISIYCPPVVVASVSQPSVCSGNSVMFTATGAMLYVWTASNGNNPQNGVSYFPTVSQNYTVVGASAQSCTGSAVVSLTVINTPTQAALATPTLICLGNSSTLSATGAFSYSWHPAGGFPGASGSSVVVSPTVTTTYTVEKSNGVCVETKTVIVIVNSLPTLYAIASPPSVCPGGFSTLIAGGGITFTWSVPGTLFSYSAQVTPTVTTIYTVAASDGTCVNTATTSVVVNTAPSISIVSSGSVVCAGQCATMSLSGALSYTWTTNPPSAPPTGTLAVVCPTVSTSYIVAGSNGTCQAQAQQIVLVNPVPTLSISASATPAIIVCGSPATLQMQSNTGQLFYAWSSGAATDSTVVTPVQMTCYTGTVTHQVTGCTNTAAICLTVNPAPVLPAGNATVCLGSSSNLSLTTPGSFTWLPGSLTGSMVNVIPLVLTTYSVSGILTNGCAAEGTFQVFPDPSCAIVWPGDANSDGVVNSSDVFEIGLAFNASGAARTTTGNIWTGHYATAWSGTVSSGANRVHGDCNGDGTINFADTLAIFNNFSLTHVFREAASQNIAISIVPESTVAGIGWSRAFIRIADASAPVSDLYGLAFTVGYEAAVIESAYLMYPASFINSGGPNVEFRKTELPAAVLHGVTVRTNGQAVSGSGTIAEFWFKPKTGIANNTSIALSLSGTRMINASAVETSLTAGDATIVYHENPVGLRLYNSGSEVLVYPNPTNGKITVSPGGHALKVSVYDLPGRLLLEQPADAVLDLGALLPGTYILLIEGEGLKTARRVVKE